MSNEAEAKGPIPSSPLRWFPEFWELGRKRLRPQMRLLGLSLVVGVIAGVGAIVFFAACQVVTHFTLDMVAGYHPHTPGGEPGLFSETDQVFRPWLILVVIVAGGLCSGFIVFTFAPEAEGHGTDAAIDAYHHRQGFIRPIVPLVKIIASALTLGTGGSGGREGPIAQIGGRVRFISGQPAAFAARGAAHPDGGGHGGGRGGHFSGAAGRGPVRRRGAVSLARLRIGSHHPGRAGQRHRLLHLRLRSSAGSRSSR